MTKDEIIEMAVKAGNSYLFDAMQTDFLQRFAALVADAEAKRIYDEGMVTVGHMREQIAAEREACANVCEEQEELRGHTPFDCAAAIRARNL